MAHKTKKIKKRGKYVKKGKIEDERKTITVGMEREKEGIGSKRRER